ncbi:4'-phosphopantetheinyl transferase superfamily protein [Streptomyces sp. NPDC006923]|uniref:4'-phosphopantetheinyl transferase family protein n=1 Tax=Streptomyces sp. NPDC006923 TaxID=3155355 RepID=UPI0034119AAF
MADGLLARLLPSPCRTAETTGHRDAADLGALHPEERRAAAGFRPRRAREFAAVRACARTALLALGEAPAPLPPGPKGAPRWPGGVVGSMTHCDGFRGAAVALSRDLLTVGIDAEPAVPLRPGLLEHICSGDRELLSVRALSARVPHVPWDKVLFSAKESVYKAWFPLTSRWLGFEHADVDLRPAAGTGTHGTFHARLLGERAVLGGRCLTGFDGRWAVGDGLVVTAVAVPAAGPG